MTRKPVIAITADHMMIRDIMPAATAYDVYIDAVIHAADALPWIVPPVAEYLDIDALLDRVDGIVCTGARSNIQPHRYQGETAPENTVQDPQRDATTLPLIPRAIDAGVPLLCICRGLQELNVALGGTLHQDVPGLPGKLNHFRARRMEYRDGASPRPTISLSNGTANWQTCPRWKQSG